jgi:hypothetical protein
MKNFSPIVAFRVGPYFRGWCVKALRANDSWETVNTADTMTGAKDKLADRATARGMIVAPDGMSAALPQEA